MSLNGGLLQLFLKLADTLFLFGYDCDGLLLFVILKVSILELSNQLPQHDHLLIGCDQLFFAFDVGKFVIVLSQPSDAVDFSHFWKCIFEPG